MAVIAKELVIPTDVKSTIASLAIACVAVLIAVDALTPVTVLVLILTSNGSSKETNSPA